MTTAAAKRMLVVDDEDGPRQSLNMIFGDEFEVTIASSGEEAIRLFAERPFHIVITDIRMRGLSGIDVLREVKKLDKHVEVIVLTAFETLETARQAISLGASEYLKKPFDLDHIQTVVNRCYDNYLFQTQQDEVIRKDVNAAKTNFLEIVSHELNTPMNGIIGFIELLQDTELDEEQQECVATIRDCSLKYFEHVQDILTYAKLTMSDMTPTECSFNPATVVLRLIAEAEVPESVTLDSAIPEDLPETVFGAENEIRIILRKLLLNALKFTREGWVKLVVEHRYLDRDSVELSFSVIDTGPGIDPGLIKGDRIFDAFTQGDSSLKRGHGGLGLGLSLCKSIANKLDGELSVDSKLGVGSTFGFKIQLDIERS
ncbi:MAG: response regulator [Verrucomicrobiota bacterium]